LLLDELMAGLTPTEVSEAMELVTRIRDTGITIFMVEQNVRRTLETADRAYVLENGQIVLEGKGKDLLQNEQVKTAYLGV
jgi:branched-chain amino acid transport system ATP-binding protein